MTRLRKLLVLAALLAAGGCTNHAELLKTHATSFRSDVYRELGEGAAVPEGQAELQITASLKTHMRGLFAADDVHGTDAYRLLVNIDGQALSLQGDTFEEKIEPRWLSDPEAGEGVRYHFKKRLRLKPGPHKIVVAIPFDGLAFDKEIVLAEGTNRLVLEPVYSASAGKKRPGLHPVKSYREGIAFLRLNLNGADI